ncbi:PCI domain-containing protein [Aphelenchoides besseyi]|nr:PCI domain-containing protein [Aphelenchoides besseyi]KAI6219940.1 PCI domain-containing protein [Aphelenchoides besseyi]
MNDFVRQAIVGLVQKTPVITYAELHQVLGTKTDRELEDGLIEAIYDGTIDLHSTALQGRLDPKEQILEIRNWQASVPDSKQWLFVKSELNEWINHTKELLVNLNETANASNQRAMYNKEADEAHEKEIENQREQLQSTNKNPTADAENRSSSVRNGGSRRKIVRKM